jgi:hypothetical protein
MKPNHIKTLLLGIIASLCLASQCNKEETPPTATNTFSALINGEPFTKAGWNPFASPPLTANYWIETNKLHIRCDAANPEFLEIRLVIDNPREGINILHFGYFSPRGIRDCGAFAVENSGQVFVTKFDTINRIVSGTFEFSGRCASVFRPDRPIVFSGDSIVQITEGRFDTRLNINPNQ